MVAGCLCTIFKNTFIIHHHMVTVLKYKLYLGKGKKTWQRARLPSPFTFFYQSPNIHILRQWSYILFFLQDDKTLYACLKQAIFDKLCCISATKTNMMPWHKRSHKDDVPMHQDVKQTHKSILWHWPNIAFVYWVTFVWSMHGVVAG